MWRCAKGYVPVQFNHLAVAAKDKQESATFLKDLLGLPEATSWGPFLSLTLDDGIRLDYAEPGVEFPGQPPPHARPIDGLVEWHLHDAFGIQVCLDPQAQADRPWCSKNPTSMAERPSWTPRVCPTRVRRP